MNNAAACDNLHDHKALLNDAFVAIVIDSAAPQIETQVENMKYRKPISSCLLSQIKIASKNEQNEKNNSEKL